MKNIKLIESVALKDSSKYGIIQEGILNDIAKGYAIAVVMELEDGEDSQYPLEDILDKFMMHVEHVIESGSGINLQYVLGGNIENIQRFKSIIGTRIYNQKFVDEEGTIRVRLVIE